MSAFCAGKGPGFAPVQLTHVELPHAATDAYEDESATVRCPGECSARPSQRGVVDSRHTHTTGVHLLGGLHVEQRAYNATGR